MSKSTCVFGDSLPRGSKDYEDGGWVRRLDKKFVYTIYNLGIGGDDTNTLLKRLETEARARYADVIIIAIGVNDSRYINEPTNMETPLENFKDNLLQLIKIAMSITDKVAFVGLMPLEESKLMPLPGKQGYYHTLANCERYNNAVKELCAKQNIAFIDLYNAFIKTDYKPLLEDGLHPNAKGHQEIAKIVGAFLEQKAWLTEDL